MATQVQHIYDENECHGDTMPRPVLTLVLDTGNYDDLERTAPGVASRGVHKNVLIGLVGLYAAMLTSFWAFFARDTATALVMTIVTVLMIVYFGLIVGGILLADTPAPDERQRSFAEFLSGRVDILTGTVTGKEVVLQMLFLPACMVVLATTVGIIARVSQGG